MFALSQPQPLYLSYSSSALLHGVLCYGGDHVLMLNLKTYQWVSLRFLPQSLFAHRLQRPRACRRHSERFAGRPRGTEPVAVEPLRHADSHRLRVARPRRRPALRPSRARFGVRARNEQNRAGWDDDCGVAGEVAGEVAGFIAGENGGSTDIIIIAISSLTNTNTTVLSHNDAGLFVAGLSVSTANETS